MQKPLIALVAIIALAVGAFLLFYHRESGTLAQNATSTPVQQIKFSTSEIREESDIYKVDAEYPHFNLPAIDTEIDALIAKDIAEFKADAVAIDYLPSAKYELTVRFDNVTMNDTVVGTRLLLSHYTGGAHPSTIAIGLEYDPRTGKKYTLDDALALTGLTLAQVASESVKQLEVQLEGTLQFPEGAAPTRDNYATFVIDERDVTFFFQQYQVAAYAAGILSVTIPRQ